MAITSNELERLGDLLLKEDEEGLTDAEVNEKERLESKAYD